MSAYYPFRSLLELLDLFVSTIVAPSCRVRLYKVDINLNPQIDFTSLTEADYGGYAPITLPTWPPAIIDNFGRALSITDVITFACDGSAPPNTVFGYFLTDGADHLWAVSRFADGGKLMVTAADTLPLRLSWAMASPATPG